MKTLVLGDWNDSNTTGTIANVGTAAIAAGLAYKAPRALSYTAGAVGLSKLVLSDAPDLIKSNGVKDVIKYGIACLSDTAMVAGTIARFVPRARPFALASTIIGIAGRTIAHFLPDSHAGRDRRVQAKSTPASTRRSVEVTLDSGEKERRDYDVFLPSNHDKKKSLPLMFVLHGVAIKPGDSWNERQV